MSPAAQSSASAKGATQAAPGRARHNTSAHGDDTYERPALVTDPAAGELVAAAVERWRAELIELAGGSSLADVGLVGDAVVDLTAAHPSGIAQLFAGRSTRLSNLLREGATLPGARRRARAVVTRAAEHAQRFGVAPTYLALGVATWTETDVPVRPSPHDMAALARVTGGRANPQTIEHEPDNVAPLRRDARTVAATSGNGQLAASGTALPDGEATQADRPSPAEPGSSARVHTNPGAPGAVATGGGADTGGAGGAPSGSTPTVTSPLVPRVTQDAHGEVSRSRGDATSDGPGHRAAQEYVPTTMPPPFLADHTPSGANPSGATPGGASPSGASPSGANGADRDGGERGGGPAASERGAEVRDAGETRAATAADRAIAGHRALTEPRDGYYVDHATEARPTTKTVRAPVILRPITITPRPGTDGDFDLTLEPAVEINPLLARTLRANGALLDPIALARNTFTGSGFDPMDALARVNSLGKAVLKDFNLVNCVIVGMFIHPGQVLVDDLDELTGLRPAMRGGTGTEPAPAGPTLERHEIIAALAGSGQAAAAIRPPLPEPRIGDADPARERGVGDLDPAQRYVVDALATGSHLFVDAPIDSDVPSVLAAVVAEAAASGRNVLYVPGHRRAADAFVAKLEAEGLGDLVLDVAPEPMWRQAVANRLLTAMADKEEPEDTTAPGIREALLDARAQLSGYIDALHLVRQPWGVSAYDALQALASLTAARPGPSTQVRLTLETVLAVGADRRRDLAAELVHAAKLGAFTARSTSNPWYGADLTTADKARDAITRVERLRDHTLPRLRAQVQSVSGSTGLIPAASLRQWGEQLRMLGGMRGTLDMFLPTIFERSVQEMVEATATKKWRADHGVDMTMRARRRYRSQAKDMIRPGVRVPNLHAALTLVQAQCAVWQTQCPRGGWPTLPDGLAGIEETYEAARIDLDELAPVLNPTAGGGGLIDLPLDELADRLAALADNNEDLTYLPTRTVLMRELKSAGLTDLLADLTVRRVPVELVAAELDLAWWSSVFEQILATEPMLASQDGAGLEAAAARFRDLDRAHIASLAAPVRVAVQDYLSTAMREHRSQAEAMFAELLEGRLTSLRDAAERYPQVQRRLRPVTVATPTLLPHVVPASRSVDLVVIDAIEHTPLELLLPAIARGRQVVVVGDPRLASTTAAGDLSAALPIVELQSHGSSRDPELSAFLAARGYSGIARPAPVPCSEALISYDQVDGTGMPDAHTGAVESTQAEVDRVVELAIEHAITRPEESLAIVTFTSLHADRIRDALSLEVRQNPALAAFFSGARPEPVVVEDLSGVSGLHRDAVVLSVGFGRTAHGRVLHRFGILSNPGSEALLLNAIAATRRRLNVVSSFAVGDLDPERLRAPGVKLLAEILQLAEDRNGVATQVILGNGVDLGGTPDRLVDDLAERLWRSGLVVETGYGIGDGDRIPLVVGHPDLPGELLVAVLTDDDAYVAERSIRVRDRQVAGRLERLGWVVAQVWSAAAFLDPDKETDRLRHIVQTERDRRMAQDPPVGGAERVVVPVLDDDADLTGR